MLVNPNYIREDKWEECKTFFDNKCAYCRSEPVLLHKDHILPASKNGTMLAFNVIPVCRQCNNSKRDKGMLKWYRGQSFYSEDKLDRIFNWMSDQYSIFYENNYGIKKIFPRKKYKLITIELPEELVRRMDEEIERNVTQYPCKCDRYIFIRKTLEAYLPK